MSVYLRVKIYTLAQEARIIRKYERRRTANTRAMKNSFVLAMASGHATAWTEQMKLNDVEREKLHNHRCGVVRPEARASHLVANFFRGTALKAAEAKSYEPPDWPKMTKMVERFRPETSTPQEILQRFAEWKDAAGEWVCPPPKPKRIRPTRNEAAP